MKTAPTMKTALLLLAAAFPASALAQAAEAAAAATPAPAPAAAPLSEAPPAPPVQEAAPAPSVASTPEQTTSAPAAVRHAFQQQYLSVNPSTGDATRGTQHEPVTRRRFFLDVRRPDLALEYQHRLDARKALYVSSGLVAGLGVVAGVIELATRPDLGSARCADADTYNNDCHPNYNRHTDLGTAFIVGGLGAGAIMALVGWRIDPEPVSNVEAQRLANEHNSSLWQQLRTRQVSVAPAVAPNGGGMALSGKF